MGLFVWYFGVNRRYDDIGHHTILMGPRYRDLIKDIFVRKRLADDFSLYLHRPTATDPSLAPPGCDAFYALSPVPNLQGGQDWRVEAEPYRQQIATWLRTTLLPGLSQPYRGLESRDAARFPRPLNVTHGEGFGFEPLLTQSAWFRPHNRSEEVRNLFLVGAGTHPGAGLPGVLSSARILDKVVPHAPLSPERPFASAQRPLGMPEPPFVRARAAFTPPRYCCLARRAGRASLSTPSAASPTTLSISKAAPRRSEPALSRLDRASMTVALSLTAADRALRRSRCAPRHSARIARSVDGRSSLGLRRPAL